MGQTLIHLSGKIAFSSPEQANEIQTTLLAHGFRFFTGSQQPRACYGVMWRRGEIRSAANYHAFRAYGVPVVDAVELPPRLNGTPRVARVPMTKEERREIAAKAQRRAAEVFEDRVMKLVHVVLVALKNIGQHEPNLYGTNSRSQARIVAWDKLYQECARLNGSVPQEGTLRTAIRRVLGEKGEPFMVPDSRRTTKAMRGV